MLFVGVGVARDVSVAKMVLMAAVLAAFFGTTIKMGVSAQR